MKFIERKWPRLKRETYQQNNSCFITICTYKRAHLFGTIENNQLIPKNKLVFEILTNKLNYISERFPGVHIPVSQTMPNHIHFIISNWSEGKYNTLDIVNWYKKGTTLDYIQGVKTGELPRFDGKIWQKGFYDHIIRNNEEKEGLTKYIINNPYNWHKDEYYKG